MPLGGPSCKLRLFRFSAKLKFQDGPSVAIKVNYFNWYNKSAKGIFLFFIADNSNPKITRKTNTTESNSKKIKEVKQKFKVNIQQKRSETKYSCTDACHETKHLSSSDSSISTNNDEEIQPREIKRPIKDYQVIRFQDNLPCVMKTTGSEDYSSHGQFSPRVSPTIHRITEGINIAASTKESKCKPNKIQICGPSPYKPFEAATPTPMVSLKGLFFNVKAKT